MFRRVVLDTNIFIDWLNRGRREEMMVGSGYVRYLSAVVLMELRVGAHSRRASRAVDALERGYAAGRRVLAPTAAVFDDAGAVLRRLQARGREIRRSSLVHDVLIALTCRAHGATLVTANSGDFEAIRALRSFELELAPPLD